MIGATRSHVSTLPETSMPGVSPTFCWLSADMARHIEVCHGLGGVIGLLQARQTRTLDSLNTPLGEDMLGDYAS